MGVAYHHKAGQTPLEEEEKEGLKIPTITTQEELDEFEQLNIEKAVEWTIRTYLKKENMLTEKFIKNLHKRMYGEVWKWAGSFRTSEKNLGVPWANISTALKQLLDDTTYWIENTVFPPEEIAIRFKHHLVSIHCFPNGNGRHSRMMADILMEVVFEKKPFPWHRSTMVKADETRKKYIKALQMADQGNIRPLLEFAQN